MSVYGELTMKRNKKLLTYLIVFLLTLTLGLSVIPCAYAAAFHTDIRVLLSVGGASVEFEAIGDYYLKEDPSFVLSSDKMTISMTGSRPMLTSDDNIFTASSITLMSRDYNGTSAYIRLKNDLYGTCTYLGDMCFDVADGSIRAINTLPIEHYLYGVLPHEMSNTFPTESLKVQAVCARGYAVANCSKYRTRAYEILDTSEDQVYHGYASVYTRAIGAVNDTAGQILTYNGDIIQAYYSASNGGQTELTGNVWTTDLPYYVQRDDIYDVENPFSLVEKSFIPSEFNAQTLALMDPLVLTSLQAGANAAAGENVTLLSTVRIKAHSAIFNPPSRMYTKADIVLMVARPDGTNGQLTVTLSLDDLVQTDEHPIGIFNAAKYTLRMRGAEQGVLTQDGVDYDGWFLTNRRYGHGIGMSQRGAQQRATDGQSYADIMSFYYADTQLCTIGTFATAPALTSDKYVVSETGVSGIKPGTLPGELLSALSSAGGNIVVISSSGAVITEEIVATGDFVRTVYGDGTSYFDLPVVLYGDVNGDGKIDQSDLDALRQHLMNTSKLTGIYLAAADVNHDGMTDSLDVLWLLKHTHGALTIEQIGGKTE
jgi:SpoIID/LytB domain protein